MKWQAPPERGPHGHELAKRIAELKQRPGTWALVEENVAQSSREKYKRRGCDTRNVQNGYEHGRVDIYARWPE